LAVLLISRGNNNWYDVVSEFIDEVLPREVKAGLGLQYFRGVDRFKSQSQ
jgi:hypothetical protein